MKNKDQYLFFISKERILESLTLTIVINPKSFWDTERELTDEYTDQQERELQPILEKAGLVSLIDNTFTSKQNRTFRELKADCENAGFICDKSFDRYMTRLNNQIYEL
jgi:hypothetical protein